MNSHALPAQLAAVRQTFPPQQVAIGAHCWELIDTGGTGPVVLLLPGGLARADTAFQWIAALAPHYRVVSLAYPTTLATLDGLLNDLFLLLDGIDIKMPIHLVGGSYSGLIAQCLVRAAPSRWASLVLSDTGVPRRARALFQAAYLPFLHSVPLTILRRMFWLGTVQFLAPLPQPEQHFWRAYFANNVAGMQRQTMLSLLHIWRDIDTNMHFAAGDLVHWPGCVLLISAGRDRMFTPAEQAQLRRLYPSARAISLPNAPHCASLAYADRYIGWARELWEGAKVRRMHDEL